MKKLNSDNHGVISNHKHLQQKNTKANNYLKLLNKSKQKIIIGDFNAKLGMKNMNIFQVGESVEPDKEIKEEAALLNLQKNINLS